MLDANRFKRLVKEWIRANPHGTVSDLNDFCEEQIPPTQFAASRWLVEQTVSWYSHILTHREASNKHFDEDESDHGDEDEGSTSASH